MRKQSSVPSGRYSRLFRLGKMASGVASSALQQSARKIVRGEMPVAREMLLTPANASRITSELAQMRGAMMKVGQLLSMEAGDLIPRELSDILGELRDSGHRMTQAQLEFTLVQVWGENWRDQFQSFDEIPFAAASIGQVHEAVDQQGRHLAIKVQYPGISRSIDSDVDNVAKFFRWFKLLPPCVDIQPLLQAAKTQLHAEADYKLEAQHLKSYHQRLGSDEVFRIPEVIDTLSGPVVLAMTYMEGESIDVLAKHRPELRDRLASRIIDLTLVEFLQWGVVQTDPNFANFRFNANDNTIGLLDFGAVHVHEYRRKLSFSRLLQAAMRKDMKQILQAASSVGYIEPDDPFNYRMAIADLIKTAAEPALQPGQYDFAHSLLSQRLTEKLFYLRKQKDFQRIPPVDVIFLHRKLAGIYLMCAKIKARVDVNSKIEQILKQQPEVSSVAI